MKKLLAFKLSILILTSLPLYANEALIGSWKNNEGLRMDFLGGFKANVGPVIYWEDDEVSKIHTWVVNTNSNELKIHYESGAYELSNDGMQLFWNTSAWKEKEDLTWEKVDNVFQTNSINLKIDPDAFVNELTKSSWSSNFNNIDLKEFTKTFSSASGILSEFDNEANLDNLQSWGVASGVLMIGTSDLYVEAIISDMYLIAVDENDSFLVLYKGDLKENEERVTLKDSREKFLSALTTGAWKQVGYYSDSIFRYRPIEGDLKGRAFLERDSKLISTSVWEFSPATGAFKEGYNEYISGINIGDLIVFVDEDGEQNAFYRDSSVELKEFSTSDVKNISISERSTDDTKNALTKQMSIGSGSDFTLFEFNSDNRTGYFHKWTSHPFQITGQTLSIDDHYPSSFEQLYIVEDYVVFDETYNSKVDVRESRMRPKTNNEAKDDVIKAVAAIEEGQNFIKIRVDLKDGSSETIPIPVSSLQDLKSISVITE